VQYVASISYGKDSLAMLHVITDVLKQPLDRIITAEVWATDDIQADLPPMVEFKDAADEIIEKRWGIKVERFCALEADGSKRTYEKCFYKRHTKSHKDYKIGNIYGFPYLKGAWCNGLLKMDAVERANSTKCEKDVSYIGIAADESVRVERHRKRDGVVLPLVEAGWTEQMCFDWCKENKLLSPLYATANRGGVGSVITKAMNNYDYCGRHTRNCGRCFSNGMMMRLGTPNSNPEKRCMITKNAFGLRTKGISTSDVRSNGIA
jgi:3'-phosphoadenosine 5'-phosphosulfate sulfotransferase (PAPS reductase)/FAD synthetase